MRNTLWPHPRKPSAAPPSRRGSSPRPRRLPAAAACLPQPPHAPFPRLPSCVCCTVRGDLIKALVSLQKRAKKFDHVLIETTGLADPAPVAFVRARALRLRARPLAIKRFTGGAAHGPGAGL